MFRFLKTLNLIHILHLALATKKMQQMQSDA